MVKISSVASFEHNSIDALNLNNQKFRLNKIKMKSKTILLLPLRKRELMSKRYKNYIAFFDCFDKSLIVLSATNGSISIASFAIIIGTPIVIASVILSLTF